MKRQMLATPPAKPLETIDRAVQAKDARTRGEAPQPSMCWVPQRPYRARLESMVHDKDLQVKLAAVTSLSESENAEPFRMALDDRTPN